MVEFIFIGGPWDGRVQCGAWFLGGALVSTGQRVHAYRLRGKPRLPVLDEHGRRIFDYIGPGGGQTSDE